MNGAGDLVLKRNSKGRLALACMLGQAHMPTKCASFPVSRGIDEAEGT